MFALGTPELLIIGILTGGLFLPLAVLAAIRLARAGSADLGQPDAVVEAARRGRVGSLAATTAGAIAMVVLVAAALAGPHGGLLLAAPLVAATLGLVVLWLAARPALREQTGTRRSAPLNARTPRLVVRTGWHLLLLGATVALVAAALLLQLRADDDDELRRWTSVGPQFAGFGAVVLSWAFVTRAAVLRPTLEAVPVAQDNALRRADAARGTRMASVGMLQAVGADLLVLVAGHLATGPMAAGTAALGVVLVVCAPWLFAIPSARLPQPAAPRVEPIPRT